MVCRKSAHTATSNSQPKAILKPYYNHGGIQIYHGDCREILATLPKVNLVLTDPPYGVTQNSWDDLTVTSVVFGILLRDFDLPIVCTCQNPSSAILITENLAYFKWSDVWEKTQSRGFLNCKVMPLRQHEDILVFCRGKMPFTPQITRKAFANVRPHSDAGASPNYGAFSKQRTRSIAIDDAYPRSIVTFADCQNGNHPNEKPVKLMAYLLASYSNTGQTILDPFMGSGTTLRAAKDLERKAVGIEIEERYCEIAANRLSQEVLTFT